MTVVSRTNAKPCLAVFGWHAQFHVSMGYVLLAEIHASTAHDLTSGGGVGAVAADGQVRQHVHL